MKPSSIIHIGANKTASTLFQKHIFAVHSSISYVGEEMLQLEQFRSHIDCLIHADNYHYETKKTEQFFRQKHKKDGRPLTFFSSEDLMGCSHPSVAAQRLRSIYGDATIVMVIRNQLTAINSWYFNHGSMLKPAPRQYWRSHVAWPDWIDNCFRDVNRSPLWAMNYDAYFDIFASVFGLDKIKVLAFEDLQDTPNAYFSNWAKILKMPPQEIEQLLEGVRTRDSQSLLAYKIHSKVKHYDAAQRIYSFLKIFDRQVKQPSFLTETDTKRISDFFREGNNRLATKTGIDIKGFGYPS